MGFMEKLKASAKNADSMAGEAVDKSRVRSKISNEETEIKKDYDKIGQLYYTAYKDGGDASSDIDEICRDIDERFARIEEYNQEITAIEAAGKAEREQNNADAEAASQRKEAEKAQRKAASEKEEE